MKRVIAKLLIGFLLALGCVAVGTQPASATADGCTMMTGPAPASYNCLNVIGKGTSVSQIEASVLATGFNVCDVRFDIWGTNADGRPYKKSSTARCGWSRAWIEDFPTTAFKSGTQICSRATWDGKPSHPTCIAINA
jgi:hypothetical protein